MCKGLIQSVTPQGFIGAKNMKTLLIILSLGLFTFTAQATAEETGFVKHPDGTIDIRHPDGRTERKYTNGRKKRCFGAFR